LPSASGWQRPASTVDFHNLDIRHAWHTQKRELCALRRSLFFGADETAPFLFIIPKTT